jgi:hypothetical protein
MSDFVDNNIFIKNNKNSSVKNNKNLSITEDKMINDALMTIGKKSNNSKTKNIINNIVNKKSTENNKKEDVNKKETYTSALNKDEIQKKLEDYMKVEDLSQVPIGTHLRYFVHKDGEYLFRMGGNLKRNTDLPKYVILKNAVGAEWSVQVKNTIFYKKMSLTEIKNEYEGIIDELHLKIKKLKSEIKSLKKK